MVKQKLTRAEDEGDRHEKSEVSTTLAHSSLAHPKVGMLRRLASKAIAAAALVALPAVGFSADTTLKTSTEEVENSRIDETLKSMRNDLYEVQELFELQGSYSHEAKTKLNNLLTSITQLDDRRKQLLYKDDLGPGEAQNFAVIQAHGREIVNLRTLAEKLKSKGKIDKQTALEIGDINYLVDNRGIIGVSHEEILKAIGESKFALHELKVKKIFEKLGDLVFTEEEINTILRADKYSGFRSPELFYVLLAYCNLTPRQEVIAYRGLLEFPIIEYYNTFILILSDLKLPSVIKKKFMEKLVEFGGNLNMFVQDQDSWQNALHSHVDDEERVSSVAEEKRYEDHKRARETVTGGGYYEGDYRDLASSLYEINPLESPHLTRDDKEKIANMMIRVGSSLDCKYMMDHYSAYISEEALDIAQQKAGEVQESVIPPFYDIAPESLKGKKINIVVHPYFNVQFPLYGIDLKSVDQKDVAAAAVNSMKRAIEQKRPNNAVPEGYIDALKITQESEHYKRLAADDGSITIFLVPKGKNPNIFKGIDNKNENLYYLETSHSNAGTMKAWDVDLLSKVLPSDGQINISGQNMGLCLQTGIASLNGLKPARRMSLEYSPSHEDMYYYELESHWPNITLPSSPDGVKSLKDVKIILDQNADFNGYYEQDMYARWQDRWNKGKTTRPEYFVAHRP